MKKALHLALLALSATTCPDANAQDSGNTRGVFHCKEAMTTNLETNYDAILALTTHFNQMIPDSYNVFIGFGRDSRNAEVYDMTIKRKNGTGKIDKTWLFGHMPDPGKLIAETLGWSHTTIMQIRKLLIDANCISIENGGNITVGFARCGDTLYLFHLLSKDLTAPEKEKYNDQQRHFLYSKNILLEIRPDSVNSPVIKEPD